MFCNRCGVQLAPGATVCAACGTAQSAAAAAAVTPGVAVADDRVRRHAKTLGILWMVLAGLSTIPIFVLLAIGTTAGVALSQANDAPPFVRVLGPMLFYCIAAVIAVFTVCSFLAGWGLLRFRSWARVLAIVMAFLVILHIPFGTALGAYTLWVLLSTGADQQYRTLSAAAG